MNAALTNINPRSPTTTYLYWAKTGSSYSSAPVINAQNPDRERRTKAKYDCNTIICLKTMVLTCGWKSEACTGGQRWK